MAEDKSAAIREELEALRDNNDGILNAESVVEFAKDTSTALHAVFEWDDTEAAHQYRLEQARRIIRINLQIIPTPEGNVKVPVYVSLVSDRTQPGGGYRRLTDVMNDPDLRAQLLEQALADFCRVQKKYENLQELTPIFSAIRRVTRRAQAHESTART